MSNGYRNGAFALGLVTGGGIILNIFLWLDYAAKHENNEPAQSGEGRNRSQISEIWDSIIGNFVSPSDTLAQWIMAIFTIAVVFLVWKTLIATQEMARDTRRVGEAQVRAYVEFQPRDISLISPNGNTALKISGPLEIVGGSPAKNLSAGLWIGDSSHEADELPIGIKMTRFRSYAAPSTKIPVFSVQAPCVNFGFDIHTAQEVWCCVFVEWIDVFGDMQRAKFQFALINKNDGARIRGSSIEKAFTTNAVSAISA